jgi:hypothetical protein
MIRFLFRSSKVYVWESPRFGSKVYFYGNSVCFELEFWRSVFELNVYRKRKGENV